MMKKKGKLGILVLATFALVGTGGGDAVAGSHTFAPPVGTCVKANASGTIFYGWEGFLNIHASQTMFIDCGVPFTINGDVEERVVIAQVNDQSTVGKVSCEMRAFDLFGNELWGGGQKHSGDTNALTGVASLTWILPQGLGLVDAYVSCSLPPEQSAPSGLFGLITAG